MMKVVLFDTEESVGNLFPITFTRPVSYIRLGITTIFQKWERYFPSVCTVKAVDFLSDLFPSDVKPDEEALYVASNVLPSEALVDELRNLKPGEALKEDDRLLAFLGNAALLETNNFKAEKKFPHKLTRIEYVFDIFLNNHEALLEDFFIITTGRESQPISTTNTVIGDFLDSEGRQLIFVEPGATVEGAILNVKNGPIYIGENAEIMEGSCVRGPVALCEDSKIRMGAKVYGATTLGPFCKAGGELSNVVMLGYSNKSHDGYLGNAVIGEWCNIGAGVNASNLKNDYSKIRIWNYRLRTFMRTDLQFCGLIMGDHSKAGVNCMFNTATVLGVGVNIHGSGFPRVFVPSFSEGSASGGFSDVSLKKFSDIAARVMERRGISLSPQQLSLFQHIYDFSQSHK